MNEPRVYKHSPIQFIILIVVMGFVFVAMFFNLDWNTPSILFPISLIILIAVAGLAAATQKTILSDDEISSQSLFGMKTLRWSEITRVSGRGYVIKLHNFDGDVTVAPSPNLPRYEEVIEIIGNKRPDL
ncbi:MAG TPA: hypothetical protein PLE39_13115, partial [Anaerolineales bacterium]|nr:hypothetical protein [Anaerolineales bacterium]